MQTKLYEDVTNPLCGKRGELDMLTAERAVRDGIANTCSDGKVLCSDNVSAIGSPFCVTSVQQCPVTDLSIIDTEFFKKEIAEQGHPWDPSY